MDVGGWNIDFTNSWSDKVLALSRIKEEEGGGKWVPIPLRK